MSSTSLTMSAQPRPDDPFRKDRESGTKIASFHGEEVLMLLGWKDIRAAARDFSNFDSSVLGRVPIPPEVGIRSFRQLPIETNPPDHAKWKSIVLPFFRRPMQPAAKEEMESVVDDHLNRAVNQGSVEAVGELALPLQSAALAVLLDTDRSIAAEWQGWGLHAFRTNGKNDPAKSERFLEFIDRMLKRGLSDPEMGLFAALHDASIDGRALTHDEKRGICHLALAGGRDTVIHAITGTIAHFAQNPDDLARLRKDPNLIPLATEEMFRFLSPLAQIGRVCPHGITIGGKKVAPGDRATLCWAAANRDPSVFENPMDVRIDRAPNPHVAFGAGTHTCLGAPMARLIVRRVLTFLANSRTVLRITDAALRPSPFGTPYLYDSLDVHFETAKQPSNHSAYASED